MKKIKDLYYYSYLSILFQWITDVFFVTPYFHFYKKTSIEFVGARPDSRRSYILISNHRTYDDPPLLGHVVKHPVAFIAKKELFANPFLYLFMVLTSTISVDRKNAEAQTFKAAKQALTRSSWFTPSWCVGVFIEGTRSKVPGQLGKPNKGPMFLARLTKVPIIPIGITYKTDKELVVKIGEPYEIDYERDLTEQAWECLEKISKLCDYSMPKKPTDSI